MTRTWPCMDAEHERRYIGDYSMLYQSIFHRLFSDFYNFFRKTNRKNQGRCDVPSLAMLDGSIHQLMVKSMLEHVQVHVEMINSMLYIMLFKSSKLLPPQLFLQFDQTIMQLYVNYRCNVCQRCVIDAVTSRSSFI